MSQAYADQTNQSNSAMGRRLTEVSAGLGAIGRYNPMAAAGGVAAGGLAYFSSHLPYAMQGDYINSETYWNESNGGYHVHQTGVSEGKPIDRWENNCWED